MYKQKVFSHLSKNACDPNNSKHLRLLQVHRQAKRFVQILPIFYLGPKRVSAILQRHSVVFGLQAKCKRHSMHSFSDLANKLFEGPEEDSIQKD